MKLQSVPTRPSTRSATTSSCTENLRPRSARNRNCLFRFFKASEVFTRRADGQCPVSLTLGRLADGPRRALSVGMMDFPRSIDNALPELDVEASDDLGSARLLVMPIRDDHESATTLPLRRGRGNVLPMPPR